MITAEMEGVVISLFGCLILITLCWIKREDKPPAYSGPGDLHDDLPAYTPSQIHIEVVSSEASQRA